MTAKTIRILPLALSSLLWLPTLSAAFGQTPSPTPGNAAQVPSAAATPPSPAASPTAPEQRALYGYQGVLVETLDGKIIASQAVNDKFNPASAVKLATALIALRTLGPQYRFNTTVWTDGQLEKETGTIRGNLYITGRDPSFHYEHAVMIALQLNALGIHTFSGDLVVPPGFSMNFDSSPRRSAEQLRATLNSTLRPEEATRTWISERLALDDAASLKSNPSVVVTGEVRVDNAPGTARPLLNQRSSKLTDILKVLLCYSNNFMAERLGENIGGVSLVRSKLVSSLGISPGDLVLSSLSGLGVNRVTPAAMMKILRALREELQKNGLSPSDIMPVAGIDPGTLQDRFADTTSRGSVIAKTGTLVRTDGGASSLIGQMKTANGEVLLFVIMNQRGSVVRFRENQDYLVNEIQRSRGGPQSFSYQPVILAMKLSDTESSGTSDEYEPVLKTNHVAP